MHVAVFQSPTNDKSTSVEPIGFMFRHRENFWVHNGWKIDLKKKKKSTKMDFSLTLLISETINSLWPTVVMPYGDIDLGEHWLR